MGYETALNKAWNEIRGKGVFGAAAVKFLADEYRIEPQASRVVSLTSHAPAKDFTAILILHYLLAAAGGLPPLEHRWVSFKELAVVEGYLAAFRKRAIEPILRKYGTSPQELITVLERLPGRKAPEGDVGIVLEAFKGVPVMILLWQGGEEFGPEANILFDESIKDIFEIEDVAVLAGAVAAAL